MDILVERRGMTQNNKLDSRFRKKKQKNIEKKEQNRQGGEMKNGWR